MKLTEIVAKIEKENNNTLYPPEINKNIKDDVIFLAGPIQGTIDWQKKAIKYLNDNRRNKSFNIASPRKNYKPTDFDYDKQVEWETFNLNKAHESGVIIFWLAKEREHDPKRAYAQTSRFEIAEWLVKTQNSNKKNILIGIEEGFSGAKYIEKRVKDNFKFVDTIYYNLEELLDKALNILK